jgi:hypothetical protein
LCDSCSKISFVDAQAGLTHSTASLTANTVSTVRFQIGSNGSFGHVEVVETATLDWTIQVPPTRQTSEAGT